MTDADVFTLAIHLAASFADFRADFSRGFDADDVVDIAVAICGLALMVICLCRMGRLTPAHRWLPRLAYVGLFTGSFCLAFAPWLFGPVYVRMGALIFAASVATKLLVLGIEWRRGKPPPELETRPAPLAATPQESPP